LSVLLTVGGGVKTELLGAVVRDAWRQCRRRPLAVVVGFLAVGATPGLPPHLTQGSQELHGWANLLIVPLLPAGIALSLLGPLFIVAYLGCPAPPGQRGGAIRAAARATRSALRPGIAAGVLMWVVVFPVQLAVLLGEFILGPTLAADPPVTTAAAVRQELVFRLVVTWPLVTLALAMLALLLPRIVLDGAREVERAVSLSGRVARRAAPVCLLIGLLQAAGVAIRAGSSTSVVLAVSAAVGLAWVFGVAMANALLWHTRPWQADVPAQPVQPPGTAGGAI
jgi:hypothetical protein